MNGGVVLDGEFTTLGEIVGRTGGILQTGPFGGQLHARDYVMLGTPVVMPVNLGDNEIHEAGIARVGAEDVRRLRRHALREGDLVFSRRGDVGRRSIVRAEQVGWLCGTGCLAARFGSDRSEVNLEYVAHYLGSNGAQTWLHDNAVGGTMPNLNTSILSALPIFMPPRQQQDEIVAVLENAGSAIARIERLIAKKQAIKQGMQQQLLTGRTRLHEFRKPWVRRALLDLVSIRNGQVDPRKPEYRDLPLIAPDHVESATGRLLKMETASDQDAISGKYLAMPGDIIYSKIRPYLKKAVLIDFPALCSADMYPLTPKGGTDGAFLLYTLLSEPFTDFATSVSMRSGIPKINRTELAEFALMAPDPSEQKAISTALSQVDKQVSILEKLRVKSKAVKQGMMQQFLTGRTRLLAKEASS